MGEQELETEMDFSVRGRVNAILTRRLELLAEVDLPTFSYTTFLSFCGLGIYYIVVSLICKLIYVINQKTEFYLQHV